MRKILKMILIGFLALVAALFLIGFFLPKTYSISQSITIQASDSVVFEAVNSFRNWEYWSPWHKMDSSNQVQYGGPTSGVGASMSWQSDKKEVGSGRQEIVDSEQNVYIKTVINFSGWDKPSYATWSFKPISEKETHVVWSYTTEVGNSILHKYISMAIMPMLKKNYAEGLANLKKYTEVTIRPS